MARTLVWPVDLPRALPADEPLAGLMARLIVLLADLSVECAGIGSEEKFPALDQGREHYRRMHFFRSSTGSLVAARDLFDHLMASATFRGWLSDEPAQGSKFVACKGAFDKRRTLVERIRNHIGEHVVEHVGATVLRFRPGDVVLAELNRETGVFSPRFAEAIMLAALMPNVPVEQWDTEFVRIVGEVRDATMEATKAMLIALHLYGKRYPILPGRD